MARVAHGINQVLGAVVLAVFFFVVITPLGLILRLGGKDPLRLRRPSGTGTCWIEVKNKTSLDRLF
jgi:hypothetical protein